jgi:hypothetical protein
MIEWHREIRLWLTGTADRKANAHGGPARTAQHSFLHCNSCYFRAAA